jgi:uncharacterized protein
MNRWSLPQLGVGVGLRTKHYSHILDVRPDVGFFEIISENYMQTAGKPLHILDSIAEHTPIVMHGVSLSIGSTAPLDVEYLTELRALRDRVRAKWVSDHLCWTGVAGKNTHDLLPLPYTEEALRHVVTRVKQVQETLAAPLLLENPSSYAGFSASTMTEAEFLGAVAREADCGILLDVNNVFVSAFNHGLDARAYIDALPADRVVQIHLAGHTHHGTHIIDSHIGPVVDPVIELYRYARQSIDASTMLEWDAAIPAFPVVHAEALRAATLPSSAPR